MEQTARMTRRRVFFEDLEKISKRLPTLTCPDHSLVRIFGTAVTFSVLKVYPNAFKCFRIFEIRRRIGCCLFRWEPSRIDTRRS